MTEIDELVKKGYNHKLLEEEEALLSIIAIFFNFNGLFGINILS